MAATIERVADALRAQGYTVHHISMKADGSGANGLTFPDGTPLDSQAAALEYLATAFDWSDQGEQDWEKARTTEAAVAIVLTGQDAQTRATRAACVALMVSLQECRAKVNELVAAAQAGDASAVQPLATGDSIADAFAQVAALLGSGAV
ncbi:hypothetical protein [Gemmata sp.]|uniref:hypothetical protein n=1 Tax=Gemmata sp. TaxID=1914242 RepID=UPI003F70B449